MGKKYLSDLKSLAAIISLAAAAGVLIDAVLTITYTIDLVVQIRYEVSAFRELPFGKLIDAFGAALVMLPVMLTPEWKQRVSDWEKVFRPALLLYLIPYNTFPGVLCAVLVITLVAFQAGRYWQAKLPEIPERLGALLALAGGGAVACWGYYLQLRSYNTQIFIWGDWNQYVEHYRHILSGNASFVQYFAGAGHWNFGVNMIMCGALKLFYAPDTVFMINALCIASVVPLGYWLSRKCGLSAYMGLLFFPLVFFNPVLSNQYMSLFYGFHPIVFFVPLLFGFFIAREYKCRWMMAVIFVLSLLVQETVCVFWAGYAIYLLCRKKWKVALLLFCAMTGLFFFFSSVVIPAAHEVEKYSQMFHYAQLGNSMGEVLLSPFTRPGAFWGTVFERNSICFTLALFVPLFFGVIFKPLMLTALLPVFAGVILQGSPDVKIVMLQYGLECTVFSMIVMVLNWKRIYPELRRPSACAVLTASCLCGILLGTLPGDKGMFRRVVNCPDAREMITFLDKAAGGAERIVSTGRIRGQFQFMRPTAAIKENYRPGDAIILDLHDNGIENGQEIARLRRKIAADRRVVPVTYLVWQNRTIVMFRVLPEAFFLPPVPWMYPAEKSNFFRAGVIIRKVPGEYELRYLRIGDRNIYRFMLDRVMDKDVEITVRQHGKDGTYNDHVVLFGNGLFPAYTVRRGTVFEFTAPGEMPERIAAMVSLRD